MFEEKLNELYQEIFQVIDEMIPIEWSNIYFYGQMSDGGGRIYFYFNEQNKLDKYIYSLKICDIYGVDKEKFEKLDYNLYILTKRLRALFIENEQKPWREVYMHLDSEGKFDMEYSYVNWLKSGFTESDEYAYFMYKHLGIPGNEEKMKKMEKYERENG